ncbi:transposase family protein [Streptomyces sp. NPDC032198]|uniref:transposase family protein n=1 Tax=Streptomyces sp. NPDC032198 TaxID=3155127 RepID=UPI0033F1A5C3
MVGGGASRAADSLHSSLSRTACPRSGLLVGEEPGGGLDDDRCRARPGCGESGTKDAVGHTMTIADGGYPRTGLVMPHRRRAGEELAEWKQEHNRSHKQVRARVEHAFAHMETWKILRGCRLKGDGVHHAMLGIAHLHNLSRAG